MKEVCWLCESKASLMNESCSQSVSAAQVKSQPEEGEVVIKVYRLRESRASLKKGACHQSLSAVRDKGQPTGGICCPEDLLAVSPQDQPP